MPIGKSYSRVSQPPFLLRVSRCAILSGCLEKSLSRCFPPDLEAPVHARGFLFALLVLPNEERISANDADATGLRNDIVTGPGGSPILLKDPSGNFVEAVSACAPLKGIAARQ